ncbi:MAG: universal stress protein [Chloroflexales bacterium]|nr:universal stress protein [Chloroflexales bacterium]
MFKAIMVPLDGSSMAEQALPMAARVARATGAALHLVHVHVAASRDPISIEGLPVVDEELRSLAAEHERVYLERVAATVAGDRLRPIVTRLDGGVVHVLTSYARDIQAGLIIMTTHGRSGFAHLWLGSVAEALVRVTGTPLLLLRPNAQGVLIDRPFKRVLIPLDGSPLAEEILSHAVALASLDGGEVVALRVIDTLPVPAAMPFHERFRIDEGTLARERAEAELYLQRVVAKLAPAIVHPRVIDAEQPARAILETATAVGADLVAVTTHGRSAVTRVPISSVTDKVLRAATQPLLILRPGMHHVD